MRGWLSLPVLDGATGDIIGMISPRPGLMTNLGTIQSYEGGGDFTFRDENGVLVRHPKASPWVQEDEALRWGFADSAYLITAIAV
jgi:hypothetical protein